MLMLKRSDLSKQFELVVQQEITNYNNSLNFVLQSIRDLKDSIENARLEALKNHSMLHSLHVGLRSDLNNLKESLGSIKLKQDISLSDQDAINKISSVQIKECINAVDQKIKIDSNFQERLDKIWKEIYDMQGINKIKYRVLNDNLDDLLRLFRKESLNLKNEILSMPTEAVKVKQELEDKINSHIIDLAGVLQELRIYKHENMVTQKKVEHIYTLIGRKESGGVL